MKTSRSPSSTSEGEVEVNFTQAILQASRVQLYATVFGGRLRLVVPDGVSVIVSGHMVLGRRRGSTPQAGPGTPVIEVKALVLGGELVVRTPPKNRRFRWWGMPGGSSPRG